MAQGFVVAVVILSSLEGTARAGKVVSGPPIVGVDVGRIAQAPAWDRAPAHRILRNARGTGGVLTRQQPVHTPYRRAASVGALGGAALGAFEGAMLGRTVGEKGAVPIMAAVVAGLGAASGAIAGGTAAAVPPRHGWRRRLHAAAVAVAVSGLAYRAFGAWIDDPGLGAREFGRTGLAHGAVMGIVLIELVPLK